MLRSATAPAVGLAFNVKGCTIGDGIVTSKVVWSADRVTVTADQMLAAGAAGAGSEAVTAKTDCVEFLRQVLAAGPMAYTDLGREARNAGLLEDGKSLSQSKPFRAARGALGIKPSQPKGVKAAGWVWALPEHQTPLDVSDAHPGVRASDSERASDKAAVATGNISIDQPVGTTTVEEETWTV
jgi:hypothetical protein